MGTVDTDKHKLIQENKYLKQELKKLTNQKNILEKINLNIQFQYILSSIFKYDILPPVKMLSDGILSFILPIKNINADSESKQDIEYRVNYTLDILHYLYMLSNPHYLYDQPNKNELQIRQTSIDKKDLDILDIVLNQYSKRRIETSTGIKDYIDKELNKPLPSIPIMEWNIHLPPTVQRSYKDYFKELYNLVKSDYNNLGYNIDEAFLARRIVHTSHSREILNEVFDIISTHTFENSEKFIDDSNETRAKFLSMFSTTVNTNEGLIEWKDFNKKNGSISLQSFNLIFKKMYEYDNTFSYSNEKSSIVSFFGYRKDGKLVKLTSDQIRDRKGKISDSNSLLVQKLTDLFKRHDK